MTDIKNIVKTVSLFCGCGGADIGVVGKFSYLKKKYSCNGFEIVHASDINNKAVDTYNLNFNHKAIAVDIHNMRFKRGQADLVIGGFPCQAFSTVNPTKKPHNKENQLFWEMARVIGQIKPKVFIAENVKGFYRLANGKFFELAKRTFVDKGYNVYDKVIDASDFGVPQKRERLIMIGIRKGIRKKYYFPEPTHSLSLNGKKAKIPLKEVIGNLIPPDPKYYFSKRAVEGVKRAKPNMKRALSQNLNNQCLTITSHLAKVSLNSRDPVLLVNEQKELYRRFTPEEAARIQSFPERFRFAGSEGDAYRQIGNAVPPVMMWHIAKSVKEHIFD